MRRIIVGISGASGVVMGQHLLMALQRLCDWDIHLIVSSSAKLTWKLEMQADIEDLYRLATVVHDENNMAASISSGSFVTEGMIVLPCSMKSLAGIVSGYTDNLLLRAADVCLKENRKLVLAPREMPLGKIHLRNMSEAADLGCTIIPPMLTFYNAPETLDDQIQHVIGKILLQFGFEHTRFKPWRGSLS